MEVAGRYDVVVLGSGAGGMAAAASAAAEGLRVLLVEKSSLVGGTTAFSGGMAWIPANTRGAGDDADRARRYLAATVPDATMAPLRDAFVEHATEAIDWLEARTALRMQPVARYPDYYPDADGATPGGRVLEPVTFDGRELGAWFERLRAPLPEFMLFGGMMVSRADIPHFRKAFRSPRSALRVGRLAASYAWQRLAWPRGTTLYLGNALAARLLKSLVDLKVDIVLNAYARRLDVQDGRVRGVVLGVGSRERPVMASAVVVATGGFAHDPRRRASLLPPETGANSTACASNTGDGIDLGEGAGGRVSADNIGNAYWVPVSRVTRSGGEQGLFPHTVTDRGKPGVIAVDRTGWRFTSEAVSYHEFVRAMLRTNAERPAVPGFLVCDSDFIWKYGLGAVKPFTRSLRRHLDSGDVVRADDIAGLAAKLGIDGEGLARTVAAFNAGAEQGRDAEFDKGGDDYQRFMGDADHRPNPCVAPIVKPPFYAVAIHPGDLGTAAGLVTDAQARVLDEAGQPIPGLYACGNDMNSIMAGAYPGPGITIGPALVFGCLAGRHIADSLRS